jgi:hypothetical protein
MTYDLLAEITQDTRLMRTSSSRGGQYNGPCPWCGGTDRFRVQPHYGPYGFFACNQCRRSGTAIDYLMLRRGCSKRQALAAVGWEPQDGVSLSEHIPRAAVLSHPGWEEPSEQWQQAAMAFSKGCQRALWSDVGRPALDYLRGRGFTDETIRKAELGYHPGAFRAPASQWGRTTWLARGIVIPWLIEGGIWRLSIRDERVTAGSGRYRQVSGGSNGLYLAESLLLKRPVVVLTEGEFDALSLAQECGDLVAVVATGTTKGSHTPRWISQLSQQERVLVAFDAERDKGDADAQWWIRRLDNAERLRPLWSDVNQMLRDGVDMREWISTALAKEAAPRGATPFESLGVSHNEPMQPQPTCLSQRLVPSALTSVSNPLARCPFIHVMPDRKGHLKGGPCQGKPLAGSAWCAEHQQSQTLLDLGAQLGYPHIPLSRHRAIGAGCGNWQAYACRAPARWLHHDLLLMRSTLASTQADRSQIPQA